MGTITKLFIEHHFEEKDIIPKDEWMSEDVPVVREEGIFEMILEEDINDKERFSLTFGSLVVKVKKAAFLHEAKKIISAQNTKVD